MALAIYPPLQEKDETTTSQWDSKSRINGVHTNTEVGPEKRKTLQLGYKADAGVSGYVRVIPPKMCVTIGIVIKQEGCLHSPPVLHITAWKQCAHKSACGHS